MAARDRSSRPTYIVESLNVMMYNKQQVVYSYYGHIIVIGIAHVSYGNGPHVLALASSGTVYSWGHNGYGQLGHGATSMYSGNPSLLSSGFTHKVIRIACGGFHSVALMENGEVKFKVIVQIFYY